MTGEWLFIVDTETTGVTPDSQAIELGWVLYRTDAGLIDCGSNLMSHIGLEPKEGVHGIPPAALMHAMPYDAVVASVVPEGSPLTFVAHNAKFDRQFLPKDWSPWICTLEDAEWPVHTTSGALVQIALALGVGVSRAHRAIDDVLTVATMLDRVRERDPGLVQWLAIAREPRVEVRGKQPFARNQEAKDLGFRWTPETKSWTKWVRVSQLAVVVAACPFPVETAQVPVSAR